MADPKHPRHFDEAFKRQIVQLYDNGKRMSELEAEYDLSHSTVARWVKAIHENGSTRAADNRTPEQHESAPFSLTGPMPPPGGFPLPSSPRIARG